MRHPRAKIIDMPLEIVQISRADEKAGVAIDSTQVSPEITHIKKPRPAALPASPPRW